MSSTIQCAYCKRDNFKSRCALSQHLVSKNDECRASMEGHMDMLHERDQGSGNDFLEFSAVSSYYAAITWIGASQNRKLWVVQLVCSSSEHTTSR